MLGGTDLDAQVLTDQGREPSISSARIARRGVGRRRVWASSLAYVGHGSATLIGATLSGGGVSCQLLSLGGSACRIDGPVRARRSWAETRRPATCLESLRGGSAAYLEGG